MLTIQPIRADIDRKYVGLSPDTTKVQPVHIANGLLRTLTGQTAETRLLNAFVYFQKHDGSIPKGHTLSDVYQELVNRSGILSQDVTEANIKTFRPLLKKVVDADNGVFLHKDQMESYTAGYIGFLSRDRIAQSGGEFVGAWLSEIGSPLRDCAVNAVAKPDDPISLLCLPLLEDRELCQFTPKIQLGDLPFWSGSIPREHRELWNGLQSAAVTLAQHLVSHPNKLFRLRLITLFACVVLFRHLVSLEGYYVPKSKGVLPLLLDFSENSQGPVARASTMSYTYACQSLVRFYSWAFGNTLRSIYRPDQLDEIDYPSYKGKEPTKDSQEIWDLALAEARQYRDQPDMAFSIAGQALYDILAIEAEADPVRYLRQLGIRCGLLWPPENLRPAKRFVLQQDLLEVLVRSCVEPGAVIDMPTLQHRLWARFGMVVGGRGEDTERLLNAGIYQADAGSLRTNRDQFAARLGGLGFARLLADGVLEVELEED